MSNITNNNIVMCDIWLNCVIFSLTLSYRREGVGVSRSTIENPAIHDRADNCKVSLHTYYKLLRATSSTNLSYREITS